MKSQSMDREAPYDGDAKRLSAEVIEGQLLAHRKVLVLLIGKLRQDCATDLMAALHSLSVMQDH